MLQNIVSAENGATKIHFLPGILVLDAESKRDGPELTRLIFKKFLPKYHIPGITEYVPIGGSTTSFYVLQESMVRVGSTLKFGKANKKASGLNGCGYLEYSYREMDEGTKRRKKPGYDSLLWECTLTAIKSASEGDGLWKVDYNLGRLTNSAMISSLEALAGEIIGDALFRHTTIRQARTNRNKVFDCSGFSPDALALNVFNPTLDRLKEAATLYHAINSYVGEHRKEIINAAQIVFAGLNLEYTADSFNFRPDEFSKRAVIAVKETVSLLYLKADEAIKGLTLPNTEALAPYVIPN